MKLVKRYAFIPLLFIFCAIVTTNLVNPHRATMAGWVLGALLTLALAMPIGQLRKKRGL